MSKLTVHVESDVRRTPRVKQVEALFDAPPERKLSRSWKLDVPIEDRDWQIGLIVGPSGAGKSTVARKLFGDALLEPDWPADKAIVDCFPESLGVKDVVKLLTSVGLSTAPTWLRPHHTLSTGEQFRADVALTLASRPELAVVDEWTSTVDRQVAKVASHTAAKTVRRRGGRLVAVTCHYDVIDWLQPDWVLQPHVEEFSWRSVQPRPEVCLDIHQVDPSAWRAFAPHHYLTAALPAGGRCFAAFVGDECVAFAQVGHVVHPSPKVRSMRRINRLVVLPDWQGLGIGTRFAEQIGEIYAAHGYRLRILTAHPGLLRAFAGSPRWRMDAHAASRLTSGKRSKMGARQASARLLVVRGFTYAPPAR